MKILDLFSGIIADKLTKAQALAIINEHNCENCFLVRGRDPQLIGLTWHGPSTKLNRELSEEK